MFTIKNYEIHPELHYEPDDHYWIEIKETIARIGIDQLEQEAKGAFVVVQLEEPGKQLKKGEIFGSIEAEKYVGQLRMPISGKIVKANSKVIESPRLINSDPYGEGWLVEIELTSFLEEEPGLVTGEMDLRAWFESELNRYEEKGWTAEL